MNRILMAVAAGADIIQGGPDKLDPIGTDVDSIVTTIIQTVFIAVGIAAVAVLIYAGTQYIMSTGDSSKRQRAQQTMIYAIAGLIVSVVAYAIVGLVIGAVESGVDGVGGNGEESSETEGD